VTGACGQQRGLKIMGVWFAVGFVIGVVGTQILGRKMGWW